MEALDGFTPGRSLGVGAALSGVNPKNLMLNVAAAATIAQAGLSGGQQGIVLVVLVLIGSIGIIAPVAVYFAMGDRAARVLGGWKTWLSANNATVMFVLFLVFGVVLIGKGISGLST
jgi:threonine/homoserine/homoserine lactone efflux protein